MIPYGLYVITGKDTAGRVTAATINCVTQASFDSVPAWIECNLVDTVERGDHSIFVGEVVKASVSAMPDGRLDEATLVLGDLGEKIFYGR
jgi:flavin reductase (DIM6/NTAB) family NADH-FMN oxidoreductase RutF